MSLQDQLDAIKTDFEKQASEEALRIMHQATDDLGKSGILESVLKVGDRMPQFELENTEGLLIRSKDILKRKLMVLSFYRGRW